MKMWGVNVVGIFCGAVSGAAKIADDVACGNDASYFQIALIRIRLILGDI